MNNICYKYKDGRYLQTNYMGDGEYELVLVNNIDVDCLFTKNWVLTEILDSCDSVYDELGEFIAETLDPNDFTQHTCDININD